MSAFPGAGAQVYYNEAGEPIGWDYPSSEPECNDDMDERYFPEDDDENEDDESSRDRLHASFHETDIGRT